jgi:hypothetical protein
MMNLWIFETETVQQMLREARFVFENNGKGSQDSMISTVEQIITELQSRNASTEDCWWFRARIVK